MYHLAFIDSEPEQTTCKRRFSPPVFESRAQPKTYFACTDFKSSDGHVVDVDFFMKDAGKKLVMRDATIHKVDGKPRYNWQEKDRYWVRVPAEK